MPSVKCPHCEAENSYAPQEAGNARTCVKCGRAIPAQLTVPPDAKPRVKAAGASPDNTEAFRVSFADAARGKESSMTGVLLALVIGLALLLLLGSFWYLNRGGQQQPLPVAIEESSKPPAHMSQLAFQRDPENFVIYFVLVDDAGREIARSGRVKLTLSEVTHMKLEGSGQFASEHKLYENEFDVDAAKFSWFDVGGFTSSLRRLVCAVKVPNSALSRLPAPRREGQVTVKFTDAKEPKLMMGLSKKFFF
jgi:hypothetical protein